MVKTGKVAQIENKQYFNYNWSLLLNENSVK